MGLLTNAVKFVIFFICQAHAAYFNIDEYCKVVPVGTRLPDLTTCDTYYQCYYNGNTKIKCFNGQYYDKQSQRCRSASEVKCYVDQLPCERSSASLVPNPEDCSGYIMCRDKKEIDRLTCPDGQIFDALNQSCTNGKCFIVDGNAVANICNVLPQNLLFGDFEQCNKWHECKNEELLTYTCKENKVFNIENSTCVVHDEFDKSCIRFRKNQPCDFKGEFRNDPHVCSIFSYCWGKYEDVFACTGYDYFEASTGRCVDRQMATPSTSCNRCEYATTQWVNAVDPTCTKYLYCQNGLPMAEGTCGPDRYFDEQRQGCIVGDKNLDKYRKANGACRVPIVKNK